MKRIITLILLLIAAAAQASEPSMQILEKQFQTMPMEARRFVQPLFWLHGTESKDRLNLYIDKMAEVHNGGFCAESRPHDDWLGPRCVILAGKPVQRMEGEEPARTSFLSTDYTRKTPKAPDRTSPALLVDRIVVFSCLVARALPPQKVMAVFSQGQRRFCFGTKGGSVQKPSFRGGTTRNPLFPNARSCSKADFSLRS
ncbi:MAG: hypothetical protein Q7T82_08605 [Armatimonadota bacterium]|nr:hypothetical protein [Armatimonadota bacterium]